MDVCRALSGPPEPLLEALGTPLLQRNVTAQSARETDSEALWPGGAPDRKLPGTGTGAPLPRPRQPVDPASSP